MSKIASDLGKIRNVTPDGNCFFRSVAIGLGFNERDHYKLRAEAIKYIRNHREDFESFIVNSKFDDYLETYSRDGQWNNSGDGLDVIIPALEKALNINVVIHNDRENGEGTVLGFNHNYQENLRTVHLSYTGTHYNVYLRGCQEYSEGMRQIQSIDASPKFGSLFRDQSLMCGLDMESQKYSQIQHEFTGLHFPKQLQQSSIYNFNEHVKKKFKL